MYIYMASRGSMDYGYLSRRPNFGIEPFLISYTLSLLRVRVTVGWAVYLGAETMWAPSCCMPPCPGHQPLWWYPGHYHHVCCRSSGSSGGSIPRAVSALQLVVKVYQAQSGGKYSRDGPSLLAALCLWSHTCLLTVSLVFCLASICHTLICSAIFPISPLPIGVAICYHKVYCFVQIALHANT